MTTILCVVREWQDLIAGLLGTAALVWTVRWALTIERRRKDSDEKAVHELEALQPETGEQGSAAPDVPD